jgi:STAS domain-containing protein
MGTGPIWQRSCSYIGMLRITIQNTSQVVLLKLEGSVKGPWVEELRKAWLAATSMANGEPINASLSAVSFIDFAGRDLLLRMRKQGVVLTGASSFLRQLLEDGSETTNDLTLKDSAEIRSSK